MKEASATGIPERFAKVLMSKFADIDGHDEMDEGNVSGSTTPVLQAVPGVPPAQSQGSETGQMTPRETAPTTEQGRGRELISSNEAAINFTKGEAKQPQKDALKEILDQPALSAAHDKTLELALDNTSVAGVKISAARSLLKKVAASSPQARRELAALIKAAEEGLPMPPPGENLAGASDALATEAPVSDEALQAAASGVTTDELAKAQVMLASQAEASSAMAGPPGGMPPEGMPPEEMPPEAQPPEQPPPAPPEEAGVPPVGATPANQ